MSAAVEQDQCVQEILEVGHCVLRNHFPVEAVMAYREAFLSLLADVAQRIPDGNRGEHRWAIGLPFARPFYHSEFFIDPTVNGIVSRILGEDMHISYYGTDTPCKGSQYQAFHADLPLLFPEQPQFRHPPLLLSLRFTFGDMTLANGPFEVAPGTQHLPRESTLAKAEAGELASFGEIRGRDRVPQELDLVVVHRSLLHDLRGAQLVAAMNNRDFRSELCQKRSFFHCRVPSANNGEFLIAEEETVARRACGEPVPHEFRFTGKTEHARRGARRRDHRLAFARRVLTVYPDLERSRREVDLRHVRIDHARSKTLRLLSKIGHQLRSHTPFGEAGIILNVGGRHELATGEHPGEADRLEIGPRRIHSSSQAGGTGADDDDVLGHP